MNDLDKNTTVHNNAILEVKNLRTCIESKDKKLFPVDGVTIDIPRGKIVGLVGESGSGKSMLANSIMSLLPKGTHVSAGQINFMGRNLLALSDEERRLLYGDRVTLIFQEPMTSLNPVMRVGYQVSEVLMLHKRISYAEGKKRTIEMFKNVGIPEPERRFYSYPHELSGGLRQRVMISAAMICKPNLLIADEPTTALDVTMQAQILQLMKRLQQQAETSVLLITHDMGVVAEICDFIYVMYAGKILEFANVFDFFSNPQHPYSIGLLNSLPSRNKGKKLCSISGTVPLLSDMPTGCRFAPRCNHVLKVCQQSFPPPVAVAPNHFVSCFFPQGDSLK